MEKIIVTASPRTVLGRKVKSLRREGILPANVYGKKVKSLSIQLIAKEFMTVYGRAGETSLVDLKIDGEVKPVLISHIQKNPVTDEIIHVDFHQVDLKEKVKAAVPLEIIGESPADKSGIGILVQQMSEIEVEALPTDLPEKIMVDVSKLENVDEAILVKDLVFDKEKVAIDQDGEQIVVKIEPPAKEEEVAPPPTEEAVGEEGAPAGESEVPAEEKEKSETEEDTGEKTDKNE